MNARDMVIDFGKHRGKKLSEVPESYLTWLCDPDANPKGVVVRGTNWSQIATQYFQEKKQQRVSEIAASAPIFTKIDGDTVERVRHLTRQLVAAIRDGQQISLSEKAVLDMLYRAGYAALPAMSYAGLILWTTNADLKGKRPEVVSNDTEVALWNLMNESGELQDEPQSKTHVYW